MYSVIDYDLNRYNYSSLNSKTKQECFMNYLQYRGNDLYECERHLDGYTQEETEKRTSKTRYVKFMEWLYDKSKDEEYVLQDMACCNFELIEHDKPIHQE